MLSRLVQDDYFRATSYDESERCQETLEGTALRRCNVKLRNKLNLTEIIPYLNQHDLVTSSDVHILQSMPVPEGVDYLISILPKPIARNFYWGVLLDKTWIFFTKLAK